MGSVVNVSHLSFLNSMGGHISLKLPAFPHMQLLTLDTAVKPTLCHGDLWDGNIQIDVETKQPIMFDSCCFYGHNES
jgi:fructosamine-3-kinase